jgi:hypothetical protein
MKKLFVFLVLLLATPAAAHDVAIDSEAAKAVLVAVANPALTPAEARRIAQLPANKMVQRKVQTFSQLATEDRFVEELLAAASGAELKGQSLFRLERTKRDREGALRTLAAIEQDRAAFVKWVADRVESFSPAGKPLALKGYLIAAGGPTGFAFGGSDFYLNITHFPDDVEGAKAVTAHELYHAVQGAAVEAAGAPDYSFSEEALAAVKTKKARDAYLVDRYLYNLLTEGVAMYVGDPELLKDSKGAYSKWDLARLRTMQGRMDRLAIMLDVTLVALTSPEAVAYDDAYALGFYGEDQPLYYLGYEMTKAIAKKKGTRRLGELITGSGCGFAREFLDAAQGNEEAPKLRERTRALIAAHCAA